MFSLICFFLLLSLNAFVKGQIPTPPSTVPPFSSTQTSVSTVNSTSGSSRPASTSTTTSSSSIPFPSLGAYSPCVTNCLAMGIARVNCTSIVDVNCFCVKDNFTAELTACILATCPEEVNTAENLARQFCNLASGTPSLSFPPVPATTVLTPSSSSSESSTMTSPSSGPSSNGSPQFGPSRGYYLTGASLIAWLGTVSALVLGFYVTF